MADNIVKRQARDRYALELRNLGQVKRELKEIEKTISGARNVGIFQAISLEIDNDMANIAEATRDRIKSNARSAKDRKSVV